MCHRVTVVANGLQQLRQQLAHLVPADRPGAARPGTANRRWCWRAVHGRGRPHAGQAEFFGHGRSAFIRPCRDGPNRGGQVELVERAERTASDRMPVKTSNSSMRAGLPGVAASRHQRRQPGRTAGRADVLRPAFRVQRQHMGDDRLGGRIVAAAAAGRLGVSSTVSIRPRRGDAVIGFSVTSGARTRWTRRTVDHVDREMADDREGEPPGARWSIRCGAWRWSSASRLGVGTPRRTPGRSSAWRGPSAGRARWPGGHRWDRCRAPVAPGSRPPARAPTTAARSASSRGPLPGPRRCVDTERPKPWCHCG